MDKAEDHGAGKPDNPYCKYCTDEQGNLLPQDQVRQKMTDFFVKTMGKGPDEAAAEVDKVMDRMPAWSGGGAAVSTSTQPTAPSGPLMPEPTQPIPASGQPAEPPAAESIPEKPPIESPVSSGMGLDVPITPKPVGAEPSTQTSSAAPTTPPTQLKKEMPTE